MVNSVTKLSLIDVMFSFSTLSPICSDTATAKWPKAGKRRSSLGTFNAVTEKVKYDIGLSLKANLMVKPRLKKE